MREDLADVVADGVGVLETPEGDYPFRAVLGREEWSRALVLLAGEIDYPNFKAEVERRQGRDRAAVYGEVWATLLGLQGR